MIRRLVGWTLPAALAITVLPACGASSGPTFRAGADGVGDPYFPLEGNRGYDAQHYLLDLRYVPASHALEGTVTVTAKAVQNLSHLDLDLSGLHVRSVRVNGTTAGFTRHGQELQITPAHGLTRGDTFDTVVRYDGTPRPITGSPIVFGAAYGWHYTTDGTFVGDEPNAASTWFPCDDHPQDKASYTFRVTVPQDRQVVANGELQSRHTRDGMATFVYRETDPMASYLATVDVGRWHFLSGRTAAGIREFVAADPSVASLVDEERVFALTGQITDFWTHEFGPYPFTSTGAIVDNVPHVGFSLETQTRPLYGFVPDSSTMAHELAHQWFGDSVSVHDWSDIWLNEGFATFAAQLWDEHTGGRSTYAWFAHEFARIPSRSSFWRQQIARPGRDTMFSSAVYERGGMTLAALRHRLGDDMFFTLLRRWTAVHRYGTATTSQFVSLADAVSGQHLDHFFHVWLYTTSKPSSFGAG